MGNKDYSPEELAHIDGFTFFRSYYEAVKALENDDANNLIRAALSYAFDNTDPVFDKPYMKALWSTMRPTIDSGIMKRINGRKGGFNGGAPIGNSNAKKNKAKTKQKQSNKNKNKEIEEEIEIESDNKRSRFVPPTVEEVRSYCEDKGYSIDPAGFVDYYEASGWMRGNTHIKDWRACVRLWKSKDSKADPQPTKLTTRPFDLNELNRIPGKEV